MPKTTTIRHFETHPPGLTGEDYYLSDEGFMVFTGTYHRKRGYCCKNGCRHCPFGFKKSKA